MGKSMSTQARPIVGYSVGTLEPEDIPRLQTLMARVEGIMQDGRWHTLAELSARCNGTEASCSARIRDLRRMGYIVARKKKTPGLYLYCAARRAPEQLALL
jgi:hypothetical protein